MGGPINSAAAPLDPRPARPSVETPKTAASLASIRSDLQTRRYSLRFRDGHDEDVYEQYEWGRLKIERALGLSLVIALTLTLSLEYDIIEYENHAIFLAIFFILRVLPLGALAVALCCPTPLLIRWWSVFAAAAFTLVVISVDLHQFLCSLEGAGVSQQCSLLASGRMPWLPLVLLGIGPLVMTVGLRCNWLDAAVAGCVCMGSFIGLMLAIQRSDFIATPIVVGIVGIVLACYAAYTEELHTRSAFRREVAAERKLLSMVTSSVTRLVGQEHSQRLNELLKRVDAVVLETTGEGIVLWVSPGCRALLAAEPEDVLRMDFLRYIFPEDVQGVRDALHTLVVEGNAIAAATPSSQSGGGGGGGWQQGPGLPLGSSELHARLQFRIRRSEVTFIWVEAELLPVIRRPTVIPGVPSPTPPGETSVLLTVRDITFERHKAVSGGRLPGAGVGPIPYSFTTSSTSLHEAPSPQSTRGVSLGPVVGGGGVLMGVAQTTGEGPAPAAAAATRAIAGGSGWPSAAGGPSGPAAIGLAGSGSGMPQAQPPTPFYDPYHERAIYTAIAVLIVPISAARVALTTAYDTVMNLSAAAVSAASSASISSGSSGAGAGSGVGSAAAAAAAAAAIAGVDLHGQPMPLALLADKQLHEGAAADVPATSASIITPPLALGNAPAAAADAAASLPAAAFAPTAAGGDLPPPASGGGTGGTGTGSAIASLPAAPPAAASAPASPATSAGAASASAITLLPGSAPTSGALTDAAPGPQSASTIALRDVTLAAGAVGDLLRMCDSSLVALHASVADALGVARFRSQQLPVRASAGVDVRAITHAAVEVARARLLAKEKQSGGSGGAAGAGAAGGRAQQLQAQAQLLQPWDAGGGGDGSVWIECCIDGEVPSSITGDAARIQLVVEMILAIALSVVRSGSGGVKLNLRVLRGTTEAPASPPSTAEGAVSSAPLLPDAALRISVSFDASTVGGVESIATALAADPLSSSSYAPVPRNCTEPVDPAAAAAGGGGSSHALTPSELGFGYRAVPSFALLLPLLRHTVLCMTGVITAGTGRDVAAAAAGIRSGALGHGDAAAAAALPVDPRIALLMVDIPLHSAVRLLTAGPTCEDPAIAHSIISHAPLDVIPTRTGTEMNVLAAGGPAPLSALAAAAAAAASSAAAAAAAGAGASSVPVDVNKLRAAPPLETSGLHILFIDDEPVNRKLGSRMLQRLGCSYVLLEDGDMAMGAIAGMTHPFDAILIDIVMQRTDGAVVCQELREQGVNCAIVAMTGNTSVRDVQRFMAAGFDLVLPKPFDIRAMGRAILEARARRARLNATMQG